jgi:enoyl-CoA hydratase/carnithine racemase
MRFAGGDLTLERAGGIATLLLNRAGKRNALTLDMWQALPAAAAALAADAGVRAVLVRGAGEQAFSGGADIEEFPRVYATPAAAAAYNAAVRAGQDAVAALPMPVIAVIFGACVGGGCGLALACDLRFAAQGARFAVPPARLGLAYPFAETLRLVQAVGPSRAKDLLFSGRLVGAAEALAIGLADRVLPEAELAAAAETYAREVAALSGISIRTGKRMVAAIAGGADAETPDLRAAFEATFAGADFAEGTRAFLEKRAPRFG